MPTSSPRVLLVVTADRATPAPTAPRKDYHVLAERLQAATLDRTSVRESRLGRALARVLGMAPAQAWLAFRRRRQVDVIVTDGEHIGLPLALLLKLAGDRTPHVTIGHRLTASKKRPLFRWLRLHSHIDRIILHSRAQYDLAIAELGIPPAHLALLPYQVDPDFWQPQPVPEEPVVSSAGLEFRDYPTLLTAADGLAARIVIGAASHWSKRRNTAADQPLPTNVEVNRFDYAALRALYARSSVVVVPLVEIDFQAGITTILEAMAMGKPVVVTHTRGQTDMVEDRRAVTRGNPPRPRPASLIRELATAAGVPVEATGLYVPPDDPAALRQALDYLLSHPAERHALGEAGRRTVERFCSVDAFATRIAQLVAAIAPNTLDEPVRTQVAVGA
jgi:glycosyltransferase involved in cell wall biosynthesis